MATITDTGFTRMKEWYKTSRPIYDEIRRWGITKPVLKAAIQAVEDYMTNGFSTRPATSIRAEIESVTGATTSIRAQYVFVIWAEWKLYNYLGGL